MYNIIAQKNSRSFEKSIPRLKRITKESWTSFSRFVFGSGNLLEAVCTLCDHKKRSWELGAILKQSYVHGRIEQMSTYISVLGSQGSHSGRREENVGMWWLI